MQKLCYYIAVVTVAVGIRLCRPVRDVVDVEIVSGPDGAVPHAFREWF